MTGTFIDYGYAITNYKKMIKPTLVPGVWQHYKVFILVFLLLVFAWVD